MKKAVQLYIGETDFTELLAFAQFLKRIGYEDYRRLAVSDEETVMMERVGDKIKKALAEIGIKPR